MKALNPILVLIILSMLVYKPGMAQKTSYTTPGGWTIGLGAGYAYQKSDIANSRGFGLDFVVGSQLYRKENAFLSVDWKFRFLAGENKAYDNRINPDGTYSNIRYSFFNYDLELGLTLNRLRESTGIILTGFAGAGLTRGRTFTDLYDAGNNLYDYSGIDPNQDSKLVYQDLVALSDGDFETSLVNKLALLPTAGIYLGYQLSRSLAIGFEFKTNICLSEENNAVGIDIDNKIIDGSGLDRNNYVSLGIRWNLRGGSSRQNTANTYSTSISNSNSNSNQVNPANPGNLTVTTSHSLPTVNITNPPNKSAQTESPNHSIKASIQNVSGPENISFYFNGFPNNSFTYNANTSAFIANVRLREGENSIRITATNQVSTAEDQAMIALNPLNEAIPAPTVEFTSPRGDQVTTSLDWIDVTSSVRQISSKEHIQLLLNGNDMPFEYYPISGMVKASVNLVKGVNQLLIKGFNETGSAQDQLEIQLTDPEMIASPTVWFINPETPAETNDRRFPLIAETQNVRGRFDVRVKLDGSDIHNFSFDAEGRISVSLYLLEGVNTVEVTARNEAGSASESTFITYYAPVQQEPVYQYPVYQEPIYQEPVYQEPVVVVPVTRSYPPVINIYSPYTNPLRTNEQSEVLHATVLHVLSKENVALYLNGMSFRDFNFSQGTNSLTARLALREGENVLTIRAQNDSGEDIKEQVFIKESKPCPMPVIKLIDPVQRQSSTNQQTFTLRAEVHNISDRKQLRLTSGRNPVPFNFSNNVLSASIKLREGLNTYSLVASNECGDDHAATRISYSPAVVVVPCTPPKVSFTVAEVKRNDATHELKGSVTGVENKADISLTLDGIAHSGFQFVPYSGDMSAKFKLTPGSHTVVVSVKNDCGTDNRGTTVIMEEPCTPPKVSFTVHEVNRNDASHELRGSVSGAKNKSDISMSVDGEAYNGFQFVPYSGDMSARFKLSPGQHTVMVSVKNDCGADSKSANLSLDEPCSPPTLSFTLNEVNREDASHELRGSVSGVKNKADISLTLDGEAYTGFQFVPYSGELSAKFKLSPGQHTIAVSVNTDCGSDGKTVTVTLEEEEIEEEESEDCGIRINPGNSTWQFCLITPSGTYSRDDLTSSNFSYSGAASSIYFMPIGGGGEATVNGQSYAIKSGQYYLFTGNINVSVSTSNPGAMGHWSVCISANKAPVSGNGNNRPESPCEEEKKGNLKGASTNNEPSDTTITRSNSGSNNATNTRTDYRTNDRSNTVTNTRTNYRTNDRSNTVTNSRTNTGSKGVTNTRTNTGSNNATNTRTNYRTDDRTKKSTSDRSVDSISSKTSTRTTTRPNSRSGDKTTSGSSSRSKR